jgi:diaminopimelate decarboxylase
MEILRAIASRYGTPTYAYDLGRIRSQIDTLRAVLPAEVEIFYSLKANASLGLCGFIAEQGLGADVASAGELVTALEAGFPAGRIFLTGPDRSPPVLQMLRSLPEVVVSVDSVSDLELLAAQEQPRRAILRLRPDYCSDAMCPAGSDSRFGLLLEDVPRCRDVLCSSQVRITGFHIFSGSQILDAGSVAGHLRSAVSLSHRAAEMLSIAPEIIDLGGGFGIPYGPGDRELDLEVIAAELRSILASTPQVRMVLELGRYLVAQAGWYLTTVLARQVYHGREAVVVDGGSHQRADL